MEQAIQELRRAVAERNYPEVQRMLAEGVPLHPKLWFPAIQVGDADLCSLLILHGLDPNISGSPRRPLHYAAEGARLEIAELLLRSGADPNARDADGMNPLDLCIEFAADERAPEMAPLLLRAGTEIGFATAIRLGDLAKVKEHLDGNRMALNALPFSASGTPLMMACRCGRLALTQFLVQRGADVHATNRRDPRTGIGGNNALWYTAQGRRTGRGPLVRFLLASGAQPDFRGEHGETALHVAVAWRHTDVAKELLEGGADPNVLTEKAETAVDFAIKMGFREMEALVRAYGGRPSESRALTAHS